MAKKIIIIDIGKTRVSAGTFTLKMEPLRFDTLDLAESGGKAELEESLSKLLGQFAVKGSFSDYQKALVCIPVEDLSIRIMEMPFEDRKKITEVLPFEMAGLLHVDVEDTLVEAVAIGEKKVLAAALEKSVMGGYIALLTSFGIDPWWAGSSIFAVPALLNGLYGPAGVKAFIDTSSMTVVENGKPRFFKPVKRLDNIRLGAAYLDEEGLRLEHVYYSGWQESDIKEVFPDARVEALKLPGDYPPDGAGVFAVSLLVKNGLIPESINFRKNEFEYTRDKTDLKKGLKVTSVLAAALIVLLAGDMLLRFRGLSRELDGYREALRSSYAELFPAEKNSADPVYQLETRIKALDKEASALGGVDVLGVLKQVADSASDDLGVRLGELSIADGRVKAKGEAVSFDAANKLKERLSAGGLFREVAVTDIKAKPGGGSYFSLNAQLR